MQKPYTIHNGNSLEVLKGLEENSIDSIVTDPPYELGFMNKKWDSTGIAYNVELWKECLRVLKPGGHLLAFSGSRTYHRMAVAIEDAGFEIRDQIMWVYGSGFPKSLDISKAIDKRGGKSVSWFGPWFRQWRIENNITQKDVAVLFPSKNGGMTGCVANWELGLNMPTIEQFNLIKETFNLPFDSMEDIEREIIGKKTAGMGTGKTFGMLQSEGDNINANKVISITAPATEEAKEWEGWGTQIKPAHEPICLARKPLIGTVAENVLEWGTGGINIGGCRVGTEDNLNGGAYAKEGNRKESQSLNSGGMNATGKTVGHDFIQPSGRFPANFIHDGSDEVVGLFPNAGSGNNTGAYNYNGREYNNKETSMFNGDKPVAPSNYNDSGSAARFFYCAKASKRDRDEGLDGFALGDPPASARRKPAEGRKNALGLPRANHHPTVKPTDLMQYLCRLITPPNGLIIDPFMGSGSTGKAAMYEGFRFIGIDLDPEYCKIAEARIEFALNKSNVKEEKKPKGVKSSKQTSSDNTDNSSSPLW
jgi:DNA modification methylase